MRGLAAVMLFVGLLGISTAAVGASGKGKDSCRVLFVGNSYTYGNDLPNVLSRLAASGKPAVKIQTDRHVKGGCTLERHVAEGEAVKKIREGAWDVVVLQEQSTRPVLEPAKMPGPARALHAKIVKSGARTVLFMTWARQHKPEMIEALARQYNAVAKELGAGVAPVGRAWQAALKARPGLVLHKKDKSHPTALGTYLAACVFYAALTGRSPQGLGNAGLKPVGEDDAAFLQQIAWQTVNGGGEKTSSNRAADFYVSTSGNDANPGTKAKPFATLQRARDAVRKKIAAGLTADVLVHVRGGTYRLAEPVVFGPVDSGTEKHRVVYAAYPGERPIFSGGRVLKGWKPGPNGTRRVTIPEAKAGKWTFNELFVGGARRVRARHPSTGSVRVVKVIDDRHSFQAKPGDLPEIKDLAGCELVLLHDWSISRTPIRSIDLKTHTLTTSQFIGGPAAFWRINGFERNPRYFLENAPELLDAPGEWYLDGKAGELTYLPMPGEKLADVEVVAPLATQLLAVRGTAGTLVRNLRFEGLTFEHCAWAPDGVRYAGGQACFHWARPPKKGWGWQAVPAAVHLESARHCRFERCTVRNVGGCGVWFAKGSRHNALMGCRVRDVAGNGVMMGEPKAEKGEALAGNNGVVNSVVERCGVTYYGAVGIWVGLSDRNAIVNNEIAHHPYTGVSVGWMWNPTPTPCAANVLQNNHIHHVMQVLSDGGGIYTLGRQPGTVLRENWIHDVPLNAGRAESNGMFLDEGTTEIVIEGNLIHGTARSPLRFHKAGKNLVRNNVMELGKGVPVVRYNATDSKNITLEGNKTVQAGKAGAAELDSAGKKTREAAGPRP